MTSGKLKRRRQSKTPSVQVAQPRAGPSSASASSATFQAHSSLPHPPQHALWDLLKCPVCYNVLKDPVTLSCGYVVCIDCMPPYKDLAFVCPVKYCARPSHILLRTAKTDVTLLKLLELATEAMTNRSQHIPPQIRPMRQRIEDALECTICACMFLDPVTTPCGHTMCHRCLLRSRDNSPLCPTCRTRLPAYSSLQTLAVNSAIYAVLSRLFPEEYFRNAREISQEENDETQLPLFVHTSVAFPSIPCAVHIYEPRYMTMLRRCLLRPQKRFGICLARVPTETDQAPFQQLGTMVDIRNVANIDDERAIVEAMAAFRFKVISSHQNNGYHTAQWEQLHDLSPEEQSYLERMEIMTATARKFKARNAAVSPGATGPALGPAMFSLGTMIVTQGQAWASRSQGSSSLQHTTKGQTPDITELELQTTEDIISNIRQFVQVFRNSDTAWLHHTSRFGPPPDTSNAFVWWAALSLPLSEQDKYKLLQFNTTRERAKLVMTWINSLKQKWWFPSSSS